MSVRRGSTREYVLLYFRNRNLDVGGVGNLPAARGTSPGEWGWVISELEAIQRNDWGTIIIRRTSKNHEKKGGDATTKHGDN